MVKGGGGGEMRRDAARCGEMQTEQGVTTVPVENALVVVGELQRGFKFDSGQIKEARGFQALVPVATNVVFQYALTVHASLPHRLQGRERERERKGYSQ